MQGFYASHSQFKSDYRYINIVNMSHFEEMPLRGNHPQIKDRPQPTYPPTPSQSKRIHAVYWTIIALLLCGFAYLYSQQKNIREAVEQRRAVLDSQRQAIQRLEKEIEKQKQINAEKKILVKNTMRSTQLKTTEIHKAAMEEYHLKKIQYIKRMSRQQWGIVRDLQKAKVSLLLAMNNFKLQHRNIHLQREINELLKTEYQRLSKEYNFSLPQKSFCVVVPTVNNNQNYRNIYNLRSILNQNYTNYKVVILDDASTDRNLQTISQYIQDNPVPQKIYLVQNKKREGTVFNIHNAANNYCLPEDIILLVDGDDQLLGINIFKVFNSVYTTRDLQVVYSNLIVNTVNIGQVKAGWSSAYDENEKKKNVYRDSSTRMFPIRTYKVSTFLKIEEKNLKTDQGQWFMSASDQAICPQVLELSCGKNDYIDQYFYLYNFGLGNNDIEVDANFNYGIMHTVRRRKKYQCPLK